MALAWQSADILDDVDPHEPAFHSLDPADILDAAATLMELLRRPAWHARAACAGQGPAQWYPGVGQPAAPAKATCESCPVRTECLATGLATPGSEDFGIWGGTSQRDRRPLRRKAA